MMKQKFTRLACLMLAFLFLVSTAAVAVSAAGGSAVTDKTIADYADKLNTISYQEYMEKYGAYFVDHKDAASETLTFDATSAWVFEKKNGSKIEVIELAGDAWKLSVYQEVEKVNEETNKIVTVRELVKDYTWDEALAAGYAEADLVYVTTYDNRTALYTPNNGSVVWTLNFGSKPASLYSIELLYYPIVGKATAVEREFYLNGEAPFSEARALTLEKIWASYKPDGTSPLEAVYTLGKKDDINAIVAEAEAAGLTVTRAEDNTSITVARPVAITQAIYEFIEKYNLRFFITDANNNELRPTMVQTPEWTTTALRDSGGFYANDFGFVVTPDANGNVKFRLDGVNESMALAEIRLKPYQGTPTYAEYIASLKNNNVDTDRAGTAQIKLEAELTSNGSSNGVYPVEDRSSAVTSPADTTRVLLNTIGTEKWSTAGQWVEYRFKLDAEGSSGMYDIYSRFKQSYLDGMYVSRMLEIYTDCATLEQYVAKYGTAAGFYNGVPFSEASGLRYDYGTNWQVTQLSNGYDLDGDGVADTYSLYFHEGVEYTIHMEVTLGTMSERVQQIQDILDALNADYLSIIKLTGTSPDDYRDYSFKRLLPDTLMDMLYQANEVEDLSNFLKSTAKVSSTYSGTCDKLAALLRDLAYDENEIAKNLDNFKTYVGNLGTFLTDAKTQPLQLDYLMIQGAEIEAPKAEANFFQSFWHECKSFIMSFFRDYNSMGAMDEGNGAKENTTIKVWFAYGRDQSQVIRNLTTNQFTPDSGVSVDLKLISGGTLLPSILANMGPDVYLGLADETVINYAIRGALNNIENMEGFSEVAETYFTRAAMLQLEIADANDVVHTYGLPETQSFQMMFLRMDILDDLGIEIPKTWEDIYTAQSILEANNMEIGLNTNYKIFLYQDGGDLYADNGMRINLDSIKGLAAFEKMCNLFTQHSFPYSYNAANRFRTGEMPIILADYTGLYNQLKVFATEIDGRWAFVPVPGTVQTDENGNVLYDEEGDPIINNTADSTISAVVMISDIPDPESAWKFMRWYVGKDCQTEYANEMVAIIGDSAKHATANRYALESMPWTRDEYVEVSKQFENLAAIPNYPGSYFIGRHTSFAFLAAYNNDADPSTELLSYINTINKEITRKREEFNLETLEIGQTLASKRMNQAMNAVDALVALVGEDSKYADMIEDLKRGVANQRSVLLNDAALQFAATLDYNYVADLNAVDKDSTLDYETTKAKKQEIINQVKTYDFFVYVSQQSAETKNGGYKISSLNEKQLVFFIAESLRNAADALDSYR